DDSTDPSEKTGTFSKIFHAVKAAVIFQRRDLGKYTQRREKSQAAQEWRREANLLARAVDSYSAGMPATLPPVGDECAAPVEGGSSKSGLKRSGTLFGMGNKRGKKDPQVVVVRSSEAYNRLEYVPTVRWVGSRWLGAGGWGVGGGWSGDPHLTLISSPFSTFPYPALSTPIRLPTRHPHPTQYFRPNGQRRRPSSYHGAASPTPVA
ncbi:hypothetical protein HDU93_009809, partial [Gonapodya sp. JEL0774]